MLHELVTEQAELRGDTVALVMESERLTYAELEAASNRLAHMLAEVGARRGDRVCLLSSKSPAAIVGMLATLKVGAAYVPIDTSSPAARIAMILRSVEPAAALVARSGMSLVEELTAGGLLADVPIGALDFAQATTDALRFAFGPDEVAAASPSAQQATGADADAAHILFTSGSTGVPKGVVITHANVRAFLGWATSYFQIKPGDRISGHPPLHFDLSTFDIYGTFAAGAELHLVPPVTMLPRQLGDFIIDGKLTQWFSVPSTFSYMSKFDALPDEGFPTLERVLWCGEVMPTPVLIQWMRRVSQATFTNLYGPTEATIASSYYTVPSIPHDESGPIPIGTPCAGEELLVVDERLRLVPDGEIGELCISGAGLSPGYWRDAERTQAAFVPDPRAQSDERRIYRTGDLALVGHDGLLRFLGRVDSQIKSRGYRIELGEIETVLNALPELAECAVVGVATEDFEGTSICCAFAPVEGIEVAPAALRTALSRSLPSYMLPSRWIALNALPKNSNGKIDRRRLRELFEQQAPTATTS